MSQKSFLKQLIEVSKNEKDCLFVFDIDSTLFNVSPRNQEIVKDFAEKSKLESDLKQILRNFKTEADDWGIRSALLRLNIESITQDLIADIKAHWNQFFFSGHFLHFDETYPGVVEFVNQLSKNAPTFYLTGRDIHRMGKETTKQLQDTGFPIDPEHNRLILKPNKEILDHIYKVDELIKLKSQFKTIYFFENEPVILNDVKSKLSDFVYPIYVDSVHSGRAELMEGIKTISPNYEIDIL